MLDLNTILKRAKLQKDMMVADFGCGSGALSMLLSKKLEQGKVFSIDIQEQPLSALQGKIKLNNINNILVIRADLEKGTDLSDYSMDAVFIVNVLFQSSGQSILKEAKRILAEKGRIIVVDWLPGAGFGPKQGRVSPDKVKEAAEKMGLQLKDEFSPGTYHYALIFQK